MSARRIAQWLLVLTLGGVSPLSAQGRAGVQVPGMPDMSNAPADVQAILKKVMSGGIPTQAEAKKLSDYPLASGVSRSTAHRLAGNTGDREKIGPCRHYMTFLSREFLQCAPSSVPRARTEKL